MFRFLLLIACVARLGSSITVSDCPSGLPRDSYLRTNGNLCYRFYISMQKDYNEAKQVCRKLGGDLAVIKSDDVNNYMVKELVQHYHVKQAAWIGLDDKSIEGTFVWADGDELHPNSNYTNFDEKEGPRKSLLQAKFEDCVAINPINGKWKDYHCSTSFFLNEDKPFICQYDAKA